VHFDITIQVAGLTACAEKTPARVELHIDVELGTVFPQLVVRAMDADNVTNAVDERTVFDSLRVDDSGRVSEVDIRLISCGAQAWIYDL
jgi:hypothetical protein